MSEGKHTQQTCKQPNGFDPEPDCAVCMEPMLPEQTSYAQKAAYRLSCGHAAQCRECVCMIARQYGPRIKCPVCRDEPRMSCTLSVYFSDPDRTSERIEVRHVSLFAKPTDVAPRLRKLHPSRYLIRKLVVNSMQWSLSKNLVELGVSPGTRQNAFVFYDDALYGGKPDKQ